MRPEYEAGPHSPIFLTMNPILQEILDWSEVWAVLIPLTILLIYKPKQPWTMPVKWYLWFALIINLIGDIIWKQQRLGIYEFLYARLPYLYNSDGSFENIVLYNLHSIIRFLLFIWFFHYQGKIFRIMNKFVPAISLLLILIDFIFIEDIRDFNSVLMASEAALLLIYCLVYFFQMLKNEDSTIKKTPSFWVVTGLSIYVVINFPIFLFYQTLSIQADNFAIDIWGLHNISFIIFCLFIAKSFYAAGTRH